MILTYLETKLRQSKSHVTFVKVQKYDPKWDHLKKESTKSRPDLDL